MADEDDGARSLIEERLDFGETYVEIEAWAIPADERHPDGVTYSMQYGTTDGETIIRYDNYPNHPGVGRHHKHHSNDPEDVEDVEFEGLVSLYRRFKREVQEHGEEW